MNLQIDPEQIERIVATALAEDLPDLTSDAIFPPSEVGRALFIVKANGILAGLSLAAAVFRQLEPASRFELAKHDGDRVGPGDVVATVEATLRTLLSGERTALNLLQRASGIATVTRAYVDAVQGTPAKILDTRKTAPGLRLLDKYAVTVGGGENHRFSLHDMTLIKNNHVDRAGSVTTAIERVRQHVPAVPLMVEVRTLEEFDQAIACSPEFILLDNMPLAMMAEAVRRGGGRIPLEASGGITLESVRAVAETGVDRISVGALTHSVRALDISLRIE